MVMGSRFSAVKIMARSICSYCFNLPIKIFRHRPLLSRLHALLNFRRIGRTDNYGIGFGLREHIAHAQRGECEAALFLQGVNAAVAFY